MFKLFCILTILIKLTIPTKSELVGVPSKGEPWNRLPCPKFFIPLSRIQYITRIIEIHWPMDTTLRIFPTSTDALTLHLQKGSSSLMGDVLPPMLRKNGRNRLSSDTAIQATSSFVPALPTANACNKVLSVHFSF